MDLPAFWAADLKGTMSYRTEGGISVRPWGQGLYKGLLEELASVEIAGEFAKIN